MKFENSAQSLMGKKAVLTGERWHHGWHVKISQCNLENFFYEFNTLSETDSKFT